MLTDAEIATMTPETRRDLIKRLAAPVDEIEPSSRWLMRTRELRLGLMVASALLLIPWIGYLAYSLPHRYVAHHWDATWVGFDILLFLPIASTAVLGTAPQLVMVTSFATGVLLVCDAWFDVMTSNTGDRGWSVATALVIELPLAALLVLGSLQMLRLVAARLWSLDKGARAWEVRIPLPSDADRAVERAPRVRA